MLYNGYKAGACCKLLNMFNPLYPFTEDVLYATVKRGGLWFVRNSFNMGEEIAGKSFLITHYNDQAKAETHYNIVSHDAYRFLYRWEDAAGQERLKLAAAKPEGYEIFSSYFYPDYKRKISKKYKEKINKYMYMHTAWKPAGRDTVHVDLYLQFGVMYLHLKYEGEELKIKFADIERIK